MEQEIFLPADSSGIASSLLAGRPVVDGEPVRAAVTNRLPQVNALNTAYLHDLLKRTQNRSGEFLWGVPVASDVMVGDFVYYDGIERRFAKGLARFLLQEEEPVGSVTSAVWGVVVRVQNHEADLCTSGLCAFRTPIREYQNHPEPGLRFLSDSLPGEPTTRPVHPPMCLGWLVGVKSSGDVQFFVRTSLTTDHRVHQHRTVELAAIPAGTCLAAHPKTITSLRTDLPGWIPASTGDLLLDFDFQFHTTDKAGWDGLAVKKIDRRGWRLRKQQWTLLPESRWCRCLARTILSSMGSSF